MAQLCPACGHSNSNKALRCERCDEYLTGHIVPDEPPPAESGQGQHPQPQPQTAPPPPPERQYGTPPPPPPGNYPQGYGQQPYYQQQQPQQQPYYGPPQETPNTTLYIILSVLELIMCCMPLGVAGLIFSILAHTAFTNGDYIKGENNLKNAKISLIIGLIGGVIVTMGIIALQIIGIAVIGSSPQQHSLY